MSTQYNSIQGPYDICRETSIACIERENVETAIKPYIRDAKVLELACGSGYYTYNFLRWGGASVVGVDISTNMMEEAKRRRPTDLSLKTEDRVKFILADCSKPTKYEDGPFDIVFGAWLLNYAPDRASLVEMYRNIELNLKPGGHFVGVTIPPTNDPRASINAECEARPLPEASGKLFYSVHNEVEDGLYFHVHAYTDLGDVAFDCYHLTSDTYEQAAREAGLKGMWEWGVTNVPQRYLEGKGEGGAGLKELKSYLTVPNYGILVIGK